MNSGSYTSCDIMKENKAYFNMNKNCRRIIRAFEEGEESVLTTHQIYCRLLEQTGTTGKRLVNCPSRQTLAQTLNKYPFFEKAGMSREKSIGGNGMDVCLWRISAVK